MGKHHREYQHRWKEDKVKQKDEEAGEGSDWRSPVSRDQEGEILEEDGKELHSGAEIFALVFGKRI